MDKDNSSNYRSAKNRSLKIFFGVLALIGIIIFSVILVSYGYSLSYSHEIEPLRFMDDWAHTSYRGSILAALLGMVVVILFDFSILAMQISKKNVAGIPWIGGILIFVGFITSPCNKAMALLGLLDPGIWEWAAYIIRDHRRNVDFYTYLDQFKGNIPDDIQNEYGEYTKEISILFKADKMSVPYRVCNPYYLNKWRTGFAIIYDESGFRYLVLDTQDKGPVPFSFSEDKLVIKGINMSGTVGDLVIEIFPVAQHII